MSRGWIFTQVQDENSMSRGRRAAQCAMDSKEKALAVLGDTADEKYPIFMTGDLSARHFSCMLGTEKTREFATKT